MRLATFSVLALALGMFLSAGAAVAADATTGTITGKVANKDGTPVAGITVTAKIHVDKKAKAAPAADAPATAPALTATTDDKGAFSIANVPAGTYDIFVKSKDERGKSTTPVTIKGGDTVDAGSITAAAGKKKAGA